MMMEALGISLGLSCARLSLSDRPGTGTRRGRRPLSIVLSGNILPRHGSRPLSTRFQEKPGRPLSEEGRPTLVYFRKSRFRKSGWVARACAYIRTCIHDIYVYRCNSLIFNNIRLFMIFFALNKGLLTQKLLTNGKRRCIFAA